ncbi:MAG: CaiB/BaiF CoA transferase family protein [Candidatus Binataceae bacterium]
MGRLPFDGIRILDFGWIFAVPHATAWLGSLGAEVIRVETTLNPDLVRFLGGTDGVPGINRSGMYNSINFSKLGIALNLTQPDAQKIARRLVELSDVVTENFTVGNMSKYGLSYDDLRAIKPDIIMLSGTPLGQTGPFARTVGFGPTTQAFAGVCHITGYPQSFPCGVGGTWPDFAVGLGMVFFLATALYHRDRTGQGQYLDLSMAEMVTSMIPEAMMDYFLNGRDARPIGNRDATMAPHGVFPVAGDDQWVAIAVVIDAEFAALCDVLGVASMATDPQYASLDARLRNVAMLEAEVAARTRDFARDDLVRALRERSVAAGPVYGAKDLMQDEVFRKSGMLVELDHPESGRRFIPGLPAQFSAVEPDYRATAAMGQHSEDVLERLLGLSADEVARLREEKAVL